jgi:hypothetical protein
VEIRVGSEGGMEKAQEALASPPITDEEADSFTVQLESDAWFMSQIIDLDPNDPSAPKEVTS